MDSIFGFLGERDERRLARMRAAVAHRGRGAAAESQDPAGTLAWQGSSDSQPGQEQRLATDGSRALVWAGQIFAIDGLPVGPQRPAMHGSRSEPVDTPAEGVAQQLLQRYLRQGIEFCQQIRGACVIAIRDGDTLHLVRDGTGQRSIYYGRCGQSWLFAIEPKGVLADPLFSRRLRPAAVAQYLAFSFIPGEATMLQDLYELPAGHWVTLRGATRDVRRYFHFERYRQQAATLLSELGREPNLLGGAAVGGDDPRLMEHWVETFRHQFRAAVAERLPTRGPVVVFLSGGLDSSVVTAEAASQAPGRVATYAIHFGDRYPNELDYARQVAQRCGTEHHEVLLRPRDFLPRMRQMIWHLDEPIGDPITMPNFELSRQVADRARFVFNGEGGDPCFGGPKNIPMLLQHWYGGLPREPGFREQQYLASYRRGYEEVSRLLSPELRAQIDPVEDLQGVLSPFFQDEQLEYFLDKLTSINIRLKGAHLILPKVERMLGAWGVVPLSPLFDQRLVELSFAMPSRLRLHQGVEKIVLKRAYADRLPASVIARPKSGMRVPVHFWFQGEMRRYARRVLSRRALNQSGIWDPSRVKQLLDYRIEEGPGRYGLRLWMLVTFETWRRIVVEGEAP